MDNVDATGDSKDTAILPVQKIVTTNIRILLVDDSKVVRETLKYCLAGYEDLAVVGSADNAGTALKEIETLNPNLVLMDIEMPGIDGIEATRAIAQKFPHIKVIAFSSHDEQKYVDRVLDAGAKGYLLKITPVDKLVNSIRFVHQGYMQFSPGLLENASDKAIALTQSPQVRIASPKQIQPHDWSSQTKELIHTLPRVSTRGLFYFLAIFAAIALPWAMLAQVDETDIDRGRLEPSGKTFIFNTPVIRLRNCKKEFWICK